AEVLCGGALVAGVGDGERGEGKEDCQDGAHHSKPPKGSTRRPSLTVVREGELLAGAWLADACELLECDRFDLGGFAATTGALACAGMATGALAFTLACAGATGDFATIGFAGTGAFVCAGVTGALAFTFACAGVTGALAFTFACA